MKMAVKSENFIDSFMDCSKHLGVGKSDLMRQSKSLVSHKIRMSLVCTRRLVGVQSCS